MHRSLSVALKKLAFRRASTIVDSLRNTNFFCCLAALVVSYNPLAHIFYQTYFAGSFLIKTNRLNKAAEVLALAVEAPFGRDDYDLISSAASTLRKIKKYDQAEKYYIKAAKLAPNVS